MFDVMIATVGKQPMPILIPILQFQPDVSTQLIVTNDVKNVTQHLSDALRANPDTKSLSVYGHQPVRPFSVADSRQRCVTILGSDSPRYEGKTFAINVTGGTTLMALGARRAAREFDVPMLYVDTDGGFIVHLAPDGTETHREPITVKVSVPVYLAAHGASVSTKTEWSMSAAEAEPAWIKPYREVARVLGETGPHSQPLLDKIRAAYSRSEDEAGAPVSLDRPRDKTRELALVLAGSGFITNFLDTSDELRFQLVQDGRVEQFLTGHWLELYVYDVCLDSGFFDDVRMSATVSRRVDHRRVENEIDVIVTRHGRLAAISCKTGLQEIEDRDVNKQAVYELDSLLQAELMGLFARKLLVTNRRSLPDALRGRARMSQIELVFGSRLPDVAERIKEHLES